MVFPNAEKTAAQNSFVVVFPTLPVTPSTVQRGEPVAVIPAHSDHRIERIAHEDSLFRRESLDRVLDEHRTRPVLRGGNGKIVSVGALAADADEHAARTDGAAVGHDRSDVKIACCLTQPL